MIPKTKRPPSPLIGAHMSIAGGMEKAFARGEKAGCAAMQVFTKNASRWQARPLSEEDRLSFRRAWEKSTIGPVIAHDSYLINLAAPEEAKWEKAISAFLDEMKRCAILGIPELVMHPGAHTGSGEAAGIERIAEAFRLIFAEAPAEVSVLIENTASQGTYIGGPFEHLAAIMDRVPNGRFGVCFDTCHAWAAGHDISDAEGYARVFEKFHRLIGIEKIRAFHLNDAKKGLGSRLDRHEHIGRGAIGSEAFALLMKDERFAEVPKIIETPKGEEDEMDRINLALLRGLAEEE